MSLQDLGLWAGVIGGGAGVIATLYTAVDSIRKGRRASIDQAGMVATTAIQLVESLKEQTESLKEELADANRQVDDLSSKLRGSLDEAAELRRQHGSMAESLTYAQAEVRVLRGQVKMLTQELDKRSNYPEDSG